MCAVGSTTIADWQPTSPVYQSCISKAEAAGGNVAGYLCPDSVRRRLGQSG